MKSPRAVVDLHSPSRPSRSPRTLNEGRDDSMNEEELRRLKQENLQLRRDLADANNRIRALETTQRSTSLFVPSTSYTDSEDDFSVEVSVTSSVTTVPTGSLSKATENTITHQPQRSVKEKSLYDIIRQRNAKYNRLTHNNLRHGKIPEISRLYSSESESDASMSTLGAASTSSMSTHVSDVMLNNTRMRKSPQVSSYAMNYFQRTDSDDSEERRCEI